jgi:hypothetical protein
MRSVILLTIAFAAACAAAACAGQPAAPDTLVDDGTHDSTSAPAQPPDAGAAAAQPSAQPSSTPPPPPPPASDAGTKAPDASIDPTSIASLFPAVVGHTWTFAISSDFPECNGERSGSVLSAQKVGGRDAVWISSYCDGQSPAAVAVGTSSADVYVNGTYISQLAEPVADGKTFQGLSGATTWHKEPLVTVPAGTFQNCWRAVSGSTYVIYCPGAGTVHIHEDYGNGVIDAQLKTKNF